MTGHAVLAVPVPGLDAFVRAHTARHDPSFLSADPAFSNAHITLLAPWLSEPTEEDLATVADVLAAAPPFEVLLEEVAVFPDGTVHLRPDPDQPLRALTARLARAFPQTPPYEGRYDDVVPHLTLDHLSTGATPASVRDDLGDLLPLRLRVDRVDLQWWVNDDCHVRHTWRWG